MRRMLLAAAALALLVAACAPSEETGQRAPTETTRPKAATRTTKPKPEADASAQVSCRHFRNVMGDVGQGLLSDAELRDKLKEVHSSASVSEAPGIAAGATAMLAAITTGTSDDLLAAAKRFDGACDRAGL